MPHRVCFKFHRNCQMWWSQYYNNLTAWTNDVNVFLDVVVVHISKIRKLLLFLITFLCVCLNAKHMHFFRNNKSIQSQLLITIFVSSQIYKAKYFKLMTMMTLKSYKVVYQVLFIRNNFLVWIRGLL